VSYDLDLDFGALSFALGTDHLQVSKTHVDGADVVYGLDLIPLYLQAGVELPFGLGIWIKPYFAINTDEDTYGDDVDVFAKFVFDIHYAINEQITAGIETTIPTYEDGIKADGLELIPYAEFSFGALGAYVKIDVTGIATDNDPSTDIQIAPILGVSYSF
jgi:hypothetical protein